MNERVMEFLVISFQNVNKSQSFLHTQPTVDQTNQHICEEKGNRMKLEKIELHVARFFYL